MTNAAPPDDLPEQVRVRREKYDRLVAAGTPPYALGYPRTTSIAEVRERLARPRDRHAPAARSSASPAASCCRRTGGKLCFATLQEGEAQIQVMVSLDGVGEERLAAWKSDVDLGDHVGITGEVISSRRGELSASWRATGS